MPRASGAAEPILAARGIDAGYGKKQVLFQVTIDVAPGEVVTLLGHNGAGKTTFLNVVSGLVKPWGGEVDLCGRKVSSLPPIDHIKIGLSRSLSENPVFRDLSVSDNIALGGFLVRDDSEFRMRRDRAFGLFPILKSRERQMAGTLSGGEQRMLALAISLMTAPKVLLLDEPSLGLQPSLVQRLLSDIRALSHADGIAVLLVEQNVRAALRVADRAYFLRLGRVLLEEPGPVALARGHWWDLF